MQKAEKSEGKREIPSEKAKSFQQGKAGRLRPGGNSGYKNKQRLR